MKPTAIKALHRPAIPLRCIAAGELDHYEIITSTSRSD